MTRLLLFEFIHADEAAYRGAPAGLKIEGRAMLKALAADASDACDVAPTVLLCKSARADCRGILSGVEVQSSNAGRSLLEQLPELIDSFDAILPVAPECEQVLLNLSRTLSQSDSRALLPSERFVEICSDKLSTWQVFQEADVPMLQCIDGTGNSVLSEEDDWVFKNRWGAGCEGVQCGASAGGDAVDVLAQRWIDAESLSVGVIGDGNDTFVLPVGRQDVQWMNGRPVYFGGSIPAEITPSISEQIHKIVEQVVSFAGEFSGHIGIDLLVENGSETVLMNEVNPRLCTSYIGYRRLLESNAVELMLGINPVATARLRRARVEFEKSGVTTVEVV